MGSWAARLIRINLVYNRFLAGYITSVSIRFNSDRFNELSDVVLSLHTLDGRCATNKYFQIIGSIHDIESYFGIDNTPSSYVQIFFSHWAHKAIIFVWVSRNLFHIAWNGNYELWEQNPIKTIPIAHGICDPHFALSNIRNKIAYNGIYNWLYTLGFDSVFFHVYNFVITDELLAVIWIPLALIHLIYLDSKMAGATIYTRTHTACLPKGALTQGARERASFFRALLGEIEFQILIPSMHKVSHSNLTYSSRPVSHLTPIFPYVAFKLFSAYFDLGKQRLNFQVGIIIGLLSIGWCAHLVHLAIPISRGRTTDRKQRWHTLFAHLAHLSVIILDASESGIATATLGSASIGSNIEFYTGNWVLYIGGMDKDNHIFRSTYAAGESSLTFFGGLKSNTISVYLTDIAHHHLGVGILFVLSTHVYLSLYKGFGHTIADLLRVNGNSATAIPLNKSLHLQLSLGCTGLARITSLTASQQVYSLRAYLYLCYDYITSLALYLHHQYIASFFVMASLAHAGILSIRDYTIISPFVACASPNNAHKGCCTVLSYQPRPRVPASRILKMKGQFISHLSWICVYLGFHTLGVYIHNDSIVAFQVQAKQILIEALNAVNDACLRLALWAGKRQLEAPYQPYTLSFCRSPTGPGDLLAHHAIALGLHVTILILFKGSLDARGSKLMPDKINFAVSFACDGPIRGGTCDISAWDSNYLALFWMLNTGAWITFYFHWKHLSVWENTVFQFDESSTYLNGWFRDYLWFNSTPLMNGYNTFGANDLCILSWAFLGAHLVWAR